MVNPEKHREYQRRYLEKNRDAVNARKVIALETTPGAREKARQIAKTWRLQNPEKARELTRVGSANRRARLRADGNQLSSTLPRRLMAEQKGKCACCAADLAKAGYHIDHVVPIAKGGENKDANAQLLCPPCNQQKGAKHPIDFMQQRGFLL